jgi:hypothetical protein
VFVLAAVQTSHEEEFATYLPFDLALKVEGVERSDALTVCVLIGHFDLLGDCRPLLALVHFRHALGQDVDARFLEHRGGSAAVVLIDEVMGWLAGNDELEAVGSDPKEVVEGLDVEFLGVEEFASGDSKE